MMLIASQQQNEQHQRQQELDEEHQERHKRYKEQHEERRGECNFNCNSQYATIAAVHDDYVDDDAQCFCPSRHECYAS